MKSLCAGLAVMTLAALAGCSQGTPGGPGTTDGKPAYGQADNTFNLSVPLMSSSLQQGEQMEATVGIERAKNFDEDVALKFGDIPKGVTIQPAQPYDQARRHGCEDHVQGRGRSSFLQVERRHPIRSRGSHPRT